MPWRKWLVRGLVLFVVAAVGAAGFLYERWTNPAAVRQVVLQQLVHHFPGASITLESAYLRLLGGIALKDLRLARNDDPDRKEFAYFPSVIVYHDKEELVRGRLAVRKLDLPHARLRVRRDRSGHWNLAGITGPLTGEHIPTFVIQDGTLILVDELAKPGAVLLELHEFNLTIVNDPLTNVRFQGNGRSDLLGRVTVRGAWDRNTDEVALSVEAGAMTISPLLRERIGNYVPELATHMNHLEGSCRVQAELGYHAQTSRPWTHDVHCQLTGGRFSHPQLPLPLDHLEANLRCLEGIVTVERLTARAGDAQVRLEHCRAHSLGSDADIDGTLCVDHLPLTSRLFGDHVSVSLQKIQKDYAPTGVVSLQIDFSRRQGEWAHHCVISPEELAICFRGFPYPLAHIGGTLEQTIDPRRHIDVLNIKLAGLTGRQPVYIQGTVSGSGPAAVVDVRVWGSDIPLDRLLMDALPRAQQKLAEQFHPTGLCDIHAHISRAAGVPDYRNTIVARFHDATVRYDVFAYPVEKVAGTLEIHPGRWRFYDFHGEHRGLVVHCEGHSMPTAQGQGLWVSIDGKNLLLDQELEEVLDPALKPSWKMLAPTGRMHFQAKVTCEPRQSPDLDVTLTAARCSIRPTFFHYELADMTGMAHYTSQRRTAKTANGPSDYIERKITLEKMVAHHGRSVVRVDNGVVELDPHGNGVYVNLEYLHGAPLIPDKDFVEALPARLQQVVNGIHLQDPVTLQTRLVVRTFASEENPTEIWWDGQLGLHDATLSAGVTFEHLTGSAGCCGKLQGDVLNRLVGNVLFEQATAYQQPFRDIHARLFVGPESPQVLEVPDLHARLFDGNVGGSARLDFSDVPRYDLNLTASQIQLQEFGQHNLPPGTLLEGEASARLVLHGKGEDVRELNGSGQLEVGPHSRLYNLPLLLDLLKVLGLRKPDGTAFEEAYAAFNIRGRRVLISQMDLFGNSFSLRGHGEMNLDGSDLDLDFYAVWAQAVQMLPPIIKDIPEAISKQLLKIRIQGRMGDVKATKEPMPAVLEPLQAFLQRVSGWQKERQSPAEVPDAPLDLPKVQLPARDLGPNDR